MKIGIETTAYWDEEDKLASMKLARSHGWECVDYQKLINQDLVNQDYRSAAIHEAQRNEKIQGEGATQYQTTNLYSDWLPLTDQVNQGLRDPQYNDDDDDEGEEPDPTLRP